MTITFKKAGEAAVTRVVKTAAKGATAADSTKTWVLQGDKGAAKPVHPTTEVKPARAVNAAEAAHMIPARESTKTSMMPWKGWVKSFLKDKLDDERYNALRNYLYFMPNDPNNLQQMPFPSTKIPISNEGKEAGFREISPGEQPPVDVPLHDLDDDPYDSGYFKRDTRRRYIDPEFPHPNVEKLKLEMQDPNDPEVQAAKEKLAAGPPSSPGNKNVFATGPSNYDPTGLRSVMAVTYEETQKSLDKHMPDHLPKPLWEQNEHELIQWYKDRDLPVPIGGNWVATRKEHRIAKW